MPSLGADMSAGTLQAWLKQPGDEVKRGDIIAVVETDKADIEVEVFAGGVIERLLVEPGTKVPVGTPLAVIHGEGEPEAPAPVPAPVVAAAPAHPPPPAPAEAPAPAPSPRPATPPGRLLVSPSARELAKELGVDLSTVAGTGPGGRIQRKDVEAAASAPARPEAVAPEEPAPEEGRKARMRAAIAAAMSHSNRDIPHLYVTQTVEMSGALAWLAQTNAKRSVKERLLYGVLLIRAVALALREVPELNGFWRDGRHEQSEAVHVGMAISLRGGGLVAPALHDADRKGLDELMGAFRDLVQRARAGTLRSSELADPTITITSLGEQGAEGVLGLIFPPQVAIVGFGRVVERPWAEDGGLFVRPLVHASLAADHRVVDGHRAGLFLAAVDRLLQTPTTLAESRS